MPNTNQRPDPDAERAARIMASLSNHLANHLAREYDVPPPGQTCRRGFPHLPCLLCGRRGSLAVILSDTRRIRCLGCGEEMALAAVKGQIAAWGAAIKGQIAAWVDVVEWLERAPACPVE